MKKYLSVFSSFHTSYRLITTSNNIRNFAFGICRLFRNTFKADKTVLVCKNIDSYGFVKISLINHRQYIKKGGISILSRREREIIKQEKEILMATRMICPLIFSETLGGIYIKRNPKKGNFTDIEKKWFLTLSEEISLGLKLFHMYREERKMMVNFIKSLTNFLDLYVPTSYLHTKSVFRLIRAVAKKMNLVESQIKSLEHATLLHDAGKIHLPSKLLKKAKPLTDEEYKIIMKHPRKGVELIKDMSILKPVIPIILHHHERYDGKGYPSRTKKENIPIGSRILAVIDAFDAMYFGRPYKKKLPLREIEKEFKKEKGKQFDPAVVDAFLKTLKRKDIKKHLSNTSKTM
ncbi:MAG: HD domain-containing phosphohydrolase [Candidatus Omnitrophota bacterium]